jgi:nucleotide-binding universal stress UspA family protein
MAARALAVGIARSEEVAPGLLIDADLLDPGVPAVAVTRCGAAASMLVVGARGAGGFSAMLLGSVGRYAASHSTCPVVIVRERTMAVHRRVVVGIREPGDGLDALGFAFEEAASRGAELAVVHVVHPRPGEDARQALADADQDLAAELRPWRDEYREVSVRQDVIQGHPAQVLARYCSRADLVILGRHDAPGMAPSIGSTWRAVLRHATAPVAVVPADASPRAPHPGPSRLAGAQAVPA